MRHMHAVTEPEAQHNLLGIIKWVRRSSRVLSWKSVYNGQTNK